MQGRLLGCFKGCPDTSMVRGVSNMSSYGCPAGLVNDPAQLVEPVPENSTVSATVASATTISLPTLPPSSYPTTPDIVYIMLDDL